jgi:uncharacterized protein (TIGR02996 family)
MTDEPIDAVWERLWTATYPVFEAAKAELAAVLRERPVTWQPIATAPKDLQNVLLRYPDSCRPSLHCRRVVGDVRVANGRRLPFDSRADTLDAAPQAAGGTVTAADLLAAVLEHPADDLPRLVLADWWEEHEQPERGEFCRVQVELAKTRGTIDPHCDGRNRKSDECGSYGSYSYDGKRWVSVPCEDCWSALRSRERELLESPIDGPMHARCRNWTDWAGAAVNLLPDGALFSDHLVFRRGFVAEVRCPLAAWLAHGPALVRQHPVERVTITDATIFASGGNDTYYIGGLGQFPNDCWSRLENHRTRAAALEALSAVCLTWARSTPADAAARGG